MQPDRSEINRYRIAAERRVERNDAEYQKVVDKMSKGIHNAYARGVRDALRLVDQGIMSSLIERVLQDYQPNSEVLDTRIKRDAALQGDNRARAGDITNIDQEGVRF